MKNSILKYTFVSATALFISSCSSDDSSLDTTKPEISLLTPKDDAHFHPGDVISLEAILKDNVELGNVKVEVHSAADGHTHQHKTADATVDFTFNKEYSIPAGSKEFVLKDNIQITTDNVTSGHYHLGLHLTDKAGNETESFIEIEIADHGHEH
ncbi:protein of unknown function [Chishuiella changwenlii]|uniref:DUF4625 domain-containing protein n=1 Tax=Chishuiella changwenlii TaxID=1434701 RepID=A0A1M6WZU7_9FLAO|nr:DUF4625 domain-containing protein [Chishuiella changwenlii]GGE98598.1 hypothetical protein GCM10010984_15240 [Chishuiella changwenlii]SHK99193.1 protein of unknown function [Chishuiella changwenlii]